MLPDSGQCYLDCILCDCTSEWCPQEPLGPLVCTFNTSFLIPPFFPHSFSIHLLPLLFWIFITLSHSLGVCKPPRVLCGKRCRRNWSVQTCIHTVSVLIHTVASCSILTPVSGGGFGSDILVLISWCLCKIRIWPVSSYLKWESSIAINIWLPLWSVHFPFPGSFEEMHTNICPVTGFPARFFLKLWLDILGH